MELALKESKQMLGKYLQVVFKNLKSLQQDGVRPGCEMLFEASYISVQMLEDRCLSEGAVCAVTPILLPFYSFHLWSK